MQATARTDPRAAATAGRWIRRTFAGWAVGFVLAIAAIIAVDSIGVSGTQSPLAIGMGLGVGLWQVRFVAALQVGGRAWVVATTLGLSLPFLIADLARLAGSALPYALAAYIALGGVTAGALQWRLLRAVPVAAPAWWLVITPIGWLLAGSTVWLNEWLPKVPGLIGALRYVAVVLSGGAILGLANALAWRLTGPGSVVGAREHVEYTGRGHSARKRQSDRATRTRPISQHGAPVHLGDERR